MAYFHYIYSLNMHSTYIEHMYSICFENDYY